MLLISIIACLIGTYTAPPTEEEVLKSFYKNIRPWGFWKPIHEKVVAEDPDFKANSKFGRDMFNVGIGIIWQTALVALPIYLILMDVLPIVITLGITVATTLILKKTWFDKLPQEKV